MFSFLVALIETWIFFDGFIFLVAASFKSLQLFLKHKPSEYTTCWIPPCWSLLWDLQFLPLIHECIAFFLQCFCYKCISTYRYLLIWNPWATKGSLVDSIMFLENNILRFHQLLFGMWFIFNIVCWKETGYYSLLFNVPLMTWVICQLLDIFWNDTYFRQLEVFCKEHYANSLLTSNMFSPNLIS